jgi:hypothetical protein
VITQQLHQLEMELQHRIQTGRFSSHRVSWNNRACVRRVCVCVCVCLCARVCVSVYACACSSQLDEWHLAALQSKHLPLTTAPLPPTPPPPPPHQDARSEIFQLRQHQSRLTNKIYRKNRLDLALVTALSWFPAVVMCLLVYTARRSFATSAAAGAAVDLVASMDLDVGMVRAQ